MKTKPLFLAVFASLALPLAAQATARAPGSLEQAAPTMPTAATERFPLYGEVHPVELQQAPAQRTREEVKRELAEHGAAPIGA